MTSTSVVGSSQVGLLCQLISSSFSLSEELRKQSEVKLKEFSVQEGFLIILLSIIGSVEIDAAVKQAGKSSAQ